MSPWSSFSAAGMLIFVYVSVLWIYSLVRRDASVIDIFWGPGFVLAALMYAFTAEGYIVRKTIVLALVTVWGLRLALHIGARNLGQPEDHRYQEWRKTGGTSWWWQSYFKVFLLQALILWLVSLPLLSAQWQLQPARLTVLDWSGLALWSVGFFFEAVGDYQLARFKRKPENKGKLLTSGLWAYTRHPNYFGESLIWWGFFLFAAACGQWLTILSPLLITFLLLKVSGVALLEKSMVKTKPGYEQYSSQTNAFLPWKKSR
jgi:steroid 5-alpha reductase family enzyme